MGVDVGNGANREEWLVLVALVLNISAAATSLVAGKASGCLFLRRRGGTKKLS